MIAGRSCYFTTEIFNSNVCLPFCSQVTQQDSQTVVSRNTVTSPLPYEKLLFPLTFYQLWSVQTLIVRLNKYISQRGSRLTQKNKHRKPTENCLLMICTGSWKFNEHLSHRKRRPEPCSQKEAGWEDQDFHILISSKYSDQPLA